MHHRTAAALAALLTLAVGAAQAADDLRGVTFKRPRGEYPHLGPVGKYYPQAAAQRSQEATVVLDCKIGEANRLNDCTVVSETVRGQGFGQAALDMAKDGWIAARKAKTPDDPTVSVKVAVPFRMAQ